VIDVKEALANQAQGYPITVTSPEGEEGTLYVRPTDGNTEYWLKVEMLVQEHLSEKKKQLPDYQLSSNDEAYIRRKACPGVVLVGWDEEDFGLPVLDSEGLFNFSSANTLLSIDWLFATVRNFSMLNGPRLRMRLSQEREDREKKAKGSADVKNGDSAMGQSSDGSSGEPPKPTRRTRSK